MDEGAPAAGRRADGERHVALLRAVNVGGTGHLPMAELRAAALAAGCIGATTIGQSGNLVFRRAAATPVATLADRLREQLRRPAVEVLVRSRAEWAAMVAANPFADAAARDPARCLAVILDREPPPEAVVALCGVGEAGEAVAAAGRTVFLHYPGGVGRSRLTTGLVERRLGARGTARNWATVERIAAALAAP